MFINVERTMMKELISIIIPVFNREQYLERCLDSIVGQTYENLEILIVNDGSTDNSPGILRKYAVQDTRIRIIDKEYGGVSDARNCGLDHATGNYIAFVDSDDWVSPTYIERLYQNIKEYNADISTVRYLKVWDNDPLEKKHSGRIKIIEYSNLGAIEEMCYQRHIDNGACGKLFAKKLFADIRYPSGKIYEDLARTYRLLWNADKTVYCSEQLYYYYQHSNSIMNKKYDIQNMDRISASAELMKWLQERTDKLTLAAETRFFVSNIQVLREIPFRDEYTRELQDIEDNIRKYRKSVLYNRKAKMNIRLIALLAFLEPRTLQRFGRLYKMIYK